MISMNLPRFHEKELDSGGYRKCANSYPEYHKSLKYHINRLSRAVFGRDAGYTNPDMGRFHM
jgi:hypothetical protein